MEEKISHWWDKLLYNVGLNNINIKTWLDPFWKLPLKIGLFKTSLRYFFKADAPEKNKIPTVNIDFRSENVVNFNAPLWGYEDRFGTWALKIMDWFMLNDKPYLYQNRANTLEKITHQYHMHEIYQKAAVIYQQLVANSPENVTEVCKVKF